MEQYRKSLKQRNLALILLIISIILLLCYSAITDIERTDFLEGFQAGLCHAIIVLSAFHILKNISLMRDEKKMQIQYNKEQDERMKTIRSKAGMPFVLIMIILMIITGMIFSYFNEVAAITLIGAASIQLVVATITKLVYSKIL